MWSVLLNPPPPHTHTHTEWEVNDSTSYQTAVTSEVCGRVVLLGREVIFQSSIIIYNKR